jgi:hypothetical protein
VCPKRVEHHHHHHASQYHAHGLGVTLGNLFGSRDSLRVWDPFIYVNSLVLWQHHHHHRDVGTHTPQPTPLPPHCQPNAPIADVKAAKCAFMSRQRHRIVLSASNDVAETWKQFFVSSTLVIHFPMTPLSYATPSMPSPHRHGECQNTQVGNHHLHGLYSLRPPLTVGWHGTNRGGLYTPSDIKSVL